MAEYGEKEIYLRWSDIKNALIDCYKDQVIDKNLSEEERKAAMLGIDLALSALERLSAADVAPVDQCADEASTAGEE